MGLSNEERRNGTFWAIRRITECARELPANEELYAKIKEFAEELWPAYLGNQQNGMHWFMGSSASNDVIGKNYTPWDTAVAESIEKSLKREEDDFPRNTDFDPFQGFLDIEGLLREPHRTVYKLFSWTEQLVYYLRRYDDEFLRRYPRLSDLCAKIQGECFACFEAEEAFARAYLAHQICEVLYSDNCPKEKRDEVTQFLYEENFQHDFDSTIHNDEIPLKRLTEIHTELLRIKHDNRRLYKNRVRRMLFALELAGQHYHYAHQHKKLREHLKTAAWKRADVVLIDAALAKFCHEKKEKSYKDDYIEALFYNRGSDNMKYEEEHADRRVADKQHVDRTHLRAKRKSAGQRRVPVRVANVPSKRTPSRRGNRSRV